MKTLNKVLAIMADLIGVGAFIGVLLLSYGNYETPDGLNIHSFLVGILSAIVTLLVAWNIYSIIDAKSLELKIESLEKELEEKLTYAHAKVDYNSATTYAFLSQSAAVQLSNLEEYTIKEQCLMFGINAIKLYSHDVDSRIEIKSVINTMIDMLDRTEHLRLDDKFCLKLILECGAIKNRGDLPNLETLIDKIEASSNIRK